MTRPPISHDWDELRGLPRPGEVLDAKYEIDGILGLGGMAVVLGARHLALGLKVAIKVLLPELCEDGVLVERFTREGRAVAQIHSENVVRVFDVGQVSGRPYLVLEHLDGSDLGKIVEIEGPQPIERAVDFVLQACEALAEAHTLGIIHRDLKPANLFLCHRADGSPCVKVLDFGISKILASGARDSGMRTLRTLSTAVMGSPHYMSPEQIVSATDVDQRTDIWALGAILHELLAGKPPFQGDAITAICAQILKDPAPPLTTERPDVPPLLEAVVLRCLDKDRDRRFANVAELARSLDGFGSPGARASAERIARVLEGGIAAEPALSPRVSPSRPERVSPPRLRAGDLAERTPRPPMTNPLGMYVLVIALASGLAGGLGWKIATQARAIRDAGRKTEPIAAIPPAPPTPSTTPPPAPVPTSVMSTTGAHVARPEAGASPPPALVASTPAPPARHTSAPRRHPAPRAPRAQVPDESQEDNPFDSPPPPRPAPTATTPAAPTPSAPDDLFDDRK